MRSKDANDKILLGNLFGSRIELNKRRSCYPINLYRFKCFAGWYSSFVHAVAKCRLSLFSFLMFACLFLALLWLSVFTSVTRLWTIPLPSIFMYFVKRNTPGCIQHLWHGSERHYRHYMKRSTSSPWFRAAAERLLILYFTESQASLIQRERSRAAVISLCCNLVVKFVI